MPADNYILILLRKSTAPGKTSDICPSSFLFAFVFYFTFILLSTFVPLIPLLPYSYLLKKLFLRHFPCFSHGSRYAFLIQSPSQRVSCLLPGFLPEENTFSGAQRSAAPESYCEALEWIAGAAIAYSSVSLSQLNSAETWEVMQTADPWDYAASSPNSISQQQRCPGQEFSLKAVQLSSNAASIPMQVITGWMPNIYQGLWTIRLEGAALTKILQVKLNQPCPGG